MNETEFKEKFKELCEEAGYAVKDIRVAKDENGLSFQGMIVKDEESKLGLKELLRKIV